MVINVLDHMDSNHIGIHSVNEVNHDVIGGLQRSVLE